MTGRLAGKVAIITGAGSGIGRAGAELFAQEGAAIVAADAREDAARETAAAVIAAGGRALAVRTDVAQSADVQAMAGACLERFGRVDILWANAGVLQRAPHSFAYLEDLPEEEWQRVLSINLTGVFLCCKYVIPHLKRQRSGAIVITASVSGMQGHAVGMASYVASKAGVVNLTRVLSNELGPFNVRVNAVAPGSVETPLVKGLSPPPAGLNFPKYYEAATDVTRQATALEVARTALHLAADDTGPLTGAIVPLDGGRTAK